jgi:hypothetical protein
VRGKVFGSLSSSLVPNFFGMGTALGGSGFSGMYRSGTGGAEGTGGAGGTGIGRLSGGNCLLSCCGRFTIVTGVIGGISGVCGGIIMMPTITSAWSAIEMMRNIVKRERRGMRCDFKMQNAK